MIFLDTSFLIGYYNIEDEHNDKAIELMKNIMNGMYGSPVISDYVFDEFITVLFSKLKKPDLVGKFGQNVLDIFDLFLLDEYVFYDSFEIFKIQEDTRFSFTDCSIISFMRLGGIDNIATFDEDFKKVNGINVVS